MLGSVTTLRIDLGFDPPERARVGALYHEAFGRKLDAALGGRDVTASVVAAALRSDRVLVARVDGVVAGVCGFHAGGAGALVITWRLLRAHLGVVSAVRAALLLTVLDRTERPGRLVLDGICVDPSQRGRGIGTALLDAAAQLARDRGHRAVALSVVDTNPRAEALYRREGFRAVGSDSVGLLASLLGFRRATTMERRVGP